MQAACRRINKSIVGILSRHTGNSEATITRNINRPKYFSPHDAVDFGIVDRVLESEDTEVSQALAAVSKGAYEWKLTDKAVDDDEAPQSGAADGAAAAP